MDSRVTQRARIADALLASIREKEFPVGSKLPSERKLAERFGVSRPVVREALGILSTLDVIEIQMGRGAFVINGDVGTEASPEYFGLLDIVDARETIEAGALRLAVQRAKEPEKIAVRSALMQLEASVRERRETSGPDMELHRAIVQSARAPLVSKLWEDMNDGIAQTIRISPHGNRMSAEILKDHQILASGVTEGLLDAALLASARLHDGHREFLRSLLG